MTDSLHAQLRKGVVEYCILALLRAEPMYGWQISERLTADGLIASIGTLYPILGRLRDRGLIEAFEERAEAGPVRKYYRVTVTGLSELESFTEAWPVFTSTVERIIGGAE